MKRIILIVVMGFTFSGLSASVGGGIRAGFNFAGTNKSEFSTKMRTGYTIGGFMEFGAGRFFGLQPELLYSMQGVRYSTTGVDWKEKWHYVNIPVMIKFYPLAGRLSIDAGPQLGYMVASQATATGGGKTNIYEDHDAMRKFDFSLGFGATYRIVKRVELGFRYNLGVTDVYKDRDGRNSVVQLNLGIRF